MRIVIASQRVGAKRRAMINSAKQSRSASNGAGLLRRVAPKKKQTDKLLILFNVMDEPPPSVLFHPRGSAKGRCGTRNKGPTPTLTVDRRSYALPIPSAHEAAGCNGHPASPRPLWAENSSNASGASRGEVANVRLVVIASQRVARMRARWLAMTVWAV